MVPVGRANSSNRSMLLMARANASNYSKPACWMARPTRLSKPVDVFYVYPTAYEKLSPNDSNYCAIDNPSMLEGAQNSFFGQAAAFETSANIYAPYYRQVDASYTLALPEEGRREALRAMPVADVISAFDYYINNYNGGRPFILAGHSQGADILLFLLSEYMSEHPDVYRRMVAAYVIGYPVTNEFIASNPHLKFAGGADDTGVIVSYNTQSPAVASGGNLIVSDAVGLVINPVNWKRDETLATAVESLGSFMPLNNGGYGKVAAYADARCDTSKGVLICSSVDENELFFPKLGKGVYHVWDYGLYYYNLRENAMTRISAFLRA